MNDYSRPLPDDVTLAVMVRLKPKTLHMVDRFGEEFGLSSRGDVISRLLEEIFDDPGESVKD